MTEEQMSMMKKLIKKHGIGATDGEWSLVYLGVRYGLSEQQVDEYLTLDTTELLLKHEKMLCIILGVDVAQDSKIPLIERYCSFCSADRAVKEGGRSQNAVE